MDVVITTEADHFQTIYNYSLSRSVGGEGLFFMSLLVQISASKSPKKSDLATCTHDSLTQI